MNDRIRQHVAPVIEPSKPTPSPDPDAGFYTMQRCRAERYGHRCLLEPGHEGQHMASNGVPFLYWDPKDATQYHGSETLGNLVWVAWAREMGIDVVQAQRALMKCCRSANVHPSVLLASLFA